GSAYFFTPKTPSTTKPAKTTTQSPIFQSQSTSPPPVPAYKDRLILPTGVWIPVKPNKAFAAAIGAELTAEGGLKLSHGATLLDSEHREIYARVAPLRVPLLSTEHPSASSLVLRQVGPRGRRLVFAPHFTHPSTYPATRETWSAPVPHE